MTKVIPDIHAFIVFAMNIAKPLVTFMLLIPYLFICLFIYLFIYLFISLFIYLFFIFLFNYVFLSKTI
jgi:hypothetical protein